MAAINSWVTFKLLRTQPLLAPRLHGFISKSLRTTVTAMTERTYYFQIPSAQVREGIRAENFQQAKAEVFNSWIQWWDEIYWENDDTTNHLLNNA